MASKYTFVKLYVAALFFLLGFSFLNAEVLFSDDFSYPSGSITETSGGRWIIQSGSALPIATGTGNIILQQGTFSNASGMDIKRLFGKTINSGKIFASFDLTQLERPEADEYFTHFLYSNVFYTRVYISPSNTGGYRIGLANTASTTSITYQDGLVIGQIYRIAVSYDFATQQSSLWVNPTASANPTLTSAGSASANANFAAIGLRQGGLAGGRQRIDNLVVATTFAEVLPVSSPPSITNVTPATVVGPALPERVNLTLNGSNFVAGLSVSLAWSSGSATLDSSNVTVLSDSQVFISVATDVTPDAWTVRVTNPDGRASNTGSFQVIPLAVGGDRVQCTENGVNVRSGSSTSSSVSGIVNSGLQGTVSSGPYKGSGYGWYYINWDNGVSGYTAQNFLTRVSGYPLAPTNLEAQAYANRVELGWDDNSLNETSFKIERKNGNADWTQIATAGSNSGNAAYYTDSGTSTHSAYTYRVRAYNAIGDSASTNEVQVMTPAGKPGPFTLANTVPLWDANISAPKVQLSWSVASDAGGYTIYRNGTILPNGGSQSPFTDASGLVATASYSYFIRASNAEGTTDSNTVTVTMPSSPTSAISVTPATTASFGSIKVGQTTDRAFVISNNGTNQASGGAVVTSPFTIQGSSSYSLGPGESQTITVRFSPFNPGNYTESINLAGSFAQKITGSAFEDPKTSTGTIDGFITRADTRRGVETISVNLEGVGDNTNIGRRTLTQKLNGALGYFKFDGVPPGTNYKLSAGGSFDSYYTKILSGVSVTANQVTSKNIELNPIPSELQPPNLSVEKTPVILVRGKGDDMDWSSGESSYWIDFRLALAFESPSFTEVWDCNEPETGVRFGTGHVINGTNGIDLNANELLIYIRDKCIKYKKDPSHPYYPPEVNIVAHSMGGLITRRMLNGSDTKTFTDQGTGLRFSVKVTKVVMLGTPNAGTLLADAAVLNPNDATKNLTTDYVTEEFNRNYFWPSSVKLYLFSGGGGDASSSITLHNASKVIKLKARDDAEKINDGAVQAPSIAGTYYKTIGKTAYAIYSFQPDLADSVGSFPDLDHYDLTKRTTTAVIGKLRGDSLGLARNVMSFAPSLGVANNIAPTQQIEEKIISVSAGQELALEVPSDAESQLSIDLHAETAGVSFLLKSPSGTIFDVATPATNPEIQYSNVTDGNGGFTASYEIANPAKGRWTILLSGPPSGAPSQCQIAVRGNSWSALIPDTGIRFENGQDVLINCRFLDFTNTPSIPLTSGQVSVALRKPSGAIENLLLADDGFHEDGLPGDGLYGLNISDLQEAGWYEVSYRSNGINELGKPIQRVARKLFFVSSGNGSFVGDPEFERMDTDGTSETDYVKLKAVINTRTAGTFRVAGELVNAFGTVRIGKSVEFACAPGDLSTASLIYNIAALRKLGEVGQFHVENLQLSEVEANGSPWLDSYQGTPVYYVGLSIISQPQSRIVASGSQVTFSVNALSNTALSYQWQFKGLSLPGETGQTLTITNVTKNDEGDYSVLVTDAVETISSLTASLLVDPRYADWRTRFFTSDELANEAISGANAMPLNDGIPNLLKFFANINPTFAMTPADQASLPKVGNEIIGVTPYLTLTYRRNALATNMNVGVETSTNLQSADWQKVEPDIVEQLSPDPITGDPVFRLKINVTGETKEFIRLRLSE